MLRVFYLDKMWYLRQVLRPRTMSSPMLQACHRAHFACHGESTANPSTIRILLSDWQSNSLAVADIAALKIQNAKLAYLSTCNSVRNRDIYLLDEGIHLAGACVLVCWLDFLMLLGLYGESMTN